MGFLANPLTWKIAAGVGGLLLGRKAQQSAMRRSPEEQQALTGAQQAAGGLTQQGLSLFSRGSELLEQPASYYGTLLRGNRAAMAQATAGPRAAITDIYRGAERGLERSNVRGAQRDVATAELGRERASRLSSLVTGVQPGAAAGLAGLSETALRGGTGAALGAGGIWRGLLNEGFANRVYGRQEGERASESIGRFIYDILSGIPWGGGKTPLENKIPPNLPPTKAPEVPRDSPTLPPTQTQSTMGSSLVDPDQRTAAQRWIDLILGRPAPPRPGGPYVLY